jgi:chromosome segregation ATPase
MPNANMVHHLDFPQYQANDVPIRPYGYSGTRAYLQAQDIAREGVPALVQALEASLDQLEEQGDYVDLQAEVEDLKKDVNEAQTEIEELEKERDDLKEKLDKLASEDNRVKDAETAREEAKDARRDADHWREMYGRIESERLKDAKVVTEAKMKLRELQDAFREIVGDDSSALLMATFWRTRAHANDVELMALRKRVAELEAPSAKRTETKALQAEVQYWKAKALEIVGGRAT